MTDTVSLHESTSTTDDPDNLPQRFKEKGWMNTAATHLQQRPLNRGIVRTAEITRLIRKLNAT